MTMQELAETLGEAAEHYTHSLFTAVIATGPPHGSASASTPQATPGRRKARTPVGRSCSYACAVPRCTSTVSRRARASS